MRVSHLALNDYRSYRGLVVEFPSGVTALLGRNGRGKTNIVEAIDYLSTFSSHRGASSANLVRVGDGGDQSPGGAVIRARVEDGARSNLLELEIARGRANRARLNRAKVNPRELLGSLRTVVFAPEDLRLLRSEPAGRRDFLDSISVKLKPHFLGILQDFTKVSRQRAAVLKQMQKSGFYQGQSAGQIPGDYSDPLHVWDQQMAELSASIVVHRMAVVDALIPLVAASYADLTDDDRQATVEYLSHGELFSSPDVLNDQSAPDETPNFHVVDGRFEGDPTPSIHRLRQTYLDELANRRGSEIVRGVNLVGAHRDDLLFSLDSLPVRGFASHGEMWTSALTLRLAEMELLRRAGDYPVLILDDVFAELDESRRAGLIKRMLPVEQVIVTVAAESDLPVELEATIFRVSRDAEGLSQVEKEEPVEEQVRTAIVSEVSDEEDQ